MPITNAATLLLAMMLAVCLPGRPASAIDDSGNFISLGPGGEACAKTAAILDHPARRANRTNALLIRAWVAGHITGLNSWVAGTPDFLAPLTLDEAVRALTRFCHANPRSSLDDAIINLEYGLIQAHRTIEPPVL